MHLVSRAAVSGNTLGCHSEGSEFISVPILEPSVIPRIELW